MDSLPTRKARGLTQAILAMTGALREQLTVLQSVDSRLSGTLATRPTGQVTALTVAAAGFTQDFDVTSLVPQAFSLNADQLSGVSVAYLVQLLGSLNGTSFTEILRIDSAGAPPDALSVAKSLSGRPFARLRVAVPTLTAATSLTVSFVAR